MNALCDIPTCKYNKVTVSEDSALATSLEHQLASINAGRMVRDNDITINKFRSLLNQLEKTFVDDRQQIADMTVKAMQLLEAKKITEKPLNIMEGMNTIFTKRLANQQYNEYAADYITLRTKGQSHKEAIDGLRALIGALTK